MKIYIGPQQKSPAVNGAADWRTAGMIDSDAFPANALAVVEAMTGDRPEPLAFVRKRGIKEWRDTAVMLVPEQLGRELLAQDSELKVRGIKASDFLLANCNLLNGRLEGEAEKNAPASVRWLRNGNVLRVGMAETTYGQFQGGQIIGQTQFYVFHLVDYARLNPNTRFIPLEAGPTRPDFQLEAGSTKPNPA